MNHLECSSLTSIVALWQEQDPMAEFERIFSKFSTAEELTGAAGDDDDEDDDAAADREGGDGALVKVRPALDSASSGVCGFAAFTGGQPDEMQFSIGLRCQ